jgi:hypothetical protein
VLAVRKATCAAYCLRLLVLLNIGPQRFQWLGDAMHYFVEIVGWSGALLILAAYALLSLGKLHGRSALYQWMNVIGSAGFVVNSGWNGAYPSAALNVVWMGIGAYVLLQSRGGR